MSRPSIRTRIAALTAALLTLISLTAATGANAATIIAAPTNPTALGAGGNSLTISWTAPAATAVTGYDIEYSTSDIINADGTLAGGTIVSIGAPVTVAALTNLEVNRRYYVHVATVTATGKSAYSVVTSSFTGTAPAAPAGLNVASYFVGGAFVSWSAPLNAGSTAVTGYRIQWSTVNTFASSVSSDSVVATMPNYAIFGLRSGARYYVRVAALNNAGVGPWTTSLSLTAQGTPNQPTMPLATATGSHNAPSLSVRLPAVSGNGGSAIDFYRVDWSTVSTFATGKFFSTYMDATSLRSATAKVKANTIYYVRVFAHNRLGFSKASTVVAVRTVK